MLNHISIIPIWQEAISWRRFRVKHRLLHFVGNNNQCAELCSQVPGSRFKSLYCRNFCLRNASIEPNF